MGKPHVKQPFAIRSYPSIMTNFIIYTIHVILLWWLNEGYSKLETRGLIESYLYEFISYMSSFGFEQWTWEHESGGQRFEWWSVRGICYLQRGTTSVWRWCYYCNSLLWRLNQWFTFLCQSAFWIKNSLESCSYVRHKCHDIPGGQTLMLWVANYSHECYRFATVWEAISIIHCTVLIWSQVKNILLAINANWFLKSCK